MTGSSERLQMLRDDEADAKREALRLIRLLQRQTAKRKRLNKTIAETRRRCARASELWNETMRAVAAIGGLP